LRQRQRARAASEQLRADAFFQGGHMRTDDGFSQAHRQRRFGERSALNHLHKHGHAVQLFDHLPAPNAFLIVQLYRTDFP
jgi:hypothetical protein